MTGVLFLSSVMLQGYGVSVVAEQVTQRWARDGLSVHIGCIHGDTLVLGDGDAEVHVVSCEPSPFGIESYCRQNDLGVVLAQTSPYFEVLPELPPSLFRVAFEHGDPTPELFSHDAHERRRIVDNKRKSVYPRVDIVTCSSHFLAEDIGWPAASVVHLGCDHVPDFGPKVVVSSDEHLTVGCLMRLGPGEALYKGNDLLLELIERLSDLKGLRFRIMGRGDQSDVDWWSRYGVEVAVNAPDEAKAQFLRESDILVSPSLWEGFNLPVVEAQALGTPSLAFDTGAHPETSAVVARSVTDMENLIRACHADRGLLQTMSDRAYRYARTAFSWDRTASELLRLIEPGLSRS